MSSSRELRISSMFIRRPGKRSTIAMKLADSHASTLQGWSAEPKNDFLAVFTELRSLDAAIHQQQHLRYWVVRRINHVAGRKLESTGATDHFLDFTPWNACK